MKFCSHDCIDQVSKYLGVRLKELTDPRYSIEEASKMPVIEYQIEGFSTIIQALAARSKIENVLGKDPVTKALIQQWLEYVILYINYVDVPANAKRILKELNQALANNTYITGTSLTIADVTLYYAIHTLMVEYHENELNCVEKAKYVNVSRWFDNLQQDEYLRRELDLINFDLLHLYV